MSEDDDSLDAYVREELPKIVKLVQSSRIRTLELKTETAELLIERVQPNEGMTLSDEAIGHLENLEHADSHLRVISAPMVGTFYHAEQTGRAPLVQEGSRVERGSLIGVIDALQVLTEVESDTSGTVQRVVVGDGEPVEFGQPLVEVLVDG